MNWPDGKFLGFKLVKIILILLILIINELSHSPYSKFQVGSAALFENDVIIPGKVYQVQFSGEPLWTITYGSLISNVRGRERPMS